jgi:hypothetical protein
MMFATLLRLGVRDAPVGDPQCFVLKERIGQFAKAQRSLLL